jgi:hypothetical protein
MEQQRCWRKMRSTHCRTLEMTEYVIREVGLNQWLVFADRQSIAFCADEDEAVKAMTEHSARRRRSAETMDIAPMGKPVGSNPTGPVVVPIHPSTVRDASRADDGFASCEIGAGAS